MKLSGLFFAAIISAMLMHAASAGSGIYIAMKPDSEFCITETLGDHGTGEYDFTFSDPGFPDSPWVSIHSVKFYTGPDNPITVPICFSSKGRKVGDEATLLFSIHTPRKNMTMNYGICISGYEDVDYGIVDSTPCKEIASNMETWGFDILMPEKYASPTEDVEFSLLISSEFPMRINLEKVDGPKLSIEETEFVTPGEFSARLTTTAPVEEGTYDFTIAAVRENCDGSYCTKTVTGTLFVAGTDERSKFDIAVSPGNKNIVGIKPAKFYINVKNNEKTQKFNIKVETDSGLLSSFNELTQEVGKGVTGTFSFIVTPKARDSSVHKITVTIENEDGIKKFSDVTLTVDEAISNIDTGVENGLVTDDNGDEMKGSYNSGDSLEKWSFMEDDFEDDWPDDMPATPELPVNWIIIVIVAAVLVIAAVFYIRKKAVVSDGIDSEHFGDSY